MANKNKNTIILRVDASKRIGMGHIVRSSFLARELRRRGYKILFIIRPYDGISAKVLKKEKLDYITIESKTSKCREAATIVSIAKRVNASAIVLDLLGLTNQFISTLRRCKAPLFLIDDLNELVKPDVDVIINGNAFAKELRYKTLKHTRLLLGEKFFLLGNEFSDSRNLIHNTRRTTVGICVSSMSLPFFKRLVDFLTSFIDTSIAIVFTLAQKKHLQDLRKRYRKNNQVRLYYDLEPKTLSDMMKDCQIFFTGAGTMMYQAAKCGCVVFAIPLHKNQQRNANALLEKQAIRLSVNSSNQLLASRKEIEKIIRNASYRKQLVNKAIKCVDGKGSMRVADTICEYIAGMK